MRHKFHRVSNYTFIGKHYREEFRKQMRSVIVFTLGFTIAFSWRETIFQWSKSITGWITHSQNGGSNAGASIFITLLCIAIILLTTRWLKEKHHVYN
jgi:hypothetical protein